MKKYFKTYAIFFKNAVSYLAQYRKDTIMYNMSNLIWIGMLFAIIEIFFAHTSAIGGWEKHEVYLLTVFFLIADELYTTFIKINLKNIPQLVTEGNLDVYLTKPINSLFLVSTQQIILRSFMRLGIHITIFLWLVWKFDFVTAWWQVPLAITFLFLGIIVQYALVLILNTTSFWFYRIDNINQTLETWNELGKYPLSVLPKTLKILFFTAIPIAYTAFVPTAIFTGKPFMFGLLFAGSFACILLFLAIWFWNFAVKRYSSASS